MSTGPGASDVAEDAQPVGHEMLAGIDYDIRIDANSAYVDAAERLHLRGEICNRGAEPLPIGRQHPDANLIGARIVDRAGNVRADTQARAAIAGDAIDPGRSAPFTLSIPGFSPASDHDRIQVSLVREDQFWLCDHGLGAVSLMVGQGRTPATDSEYPSGGGVDARHSAAADQPAEIAGRAVPKTSLQTYEETRLGLDRQATFDDLWYCYRLLFDRRPDPGGFEQFSQVIRAGMPLNALVDFFIASEEFTARFSPDRAAPPERMRINGVDLYLPAPQTPVERHVQATGQYKPHLAGVIGSILEPHQLVLDVGAGSGEFSALAARKIGAGGRLISLEPDPHLYRLLLANVMSLNLANVDVLPFAAADGDGFVSLVKRGAIATSREVAQADLTGAEEVAVVYARTIDSIIPADRQIDVIRLALDGFDYRAMAGAGTLLKTWRPAILGEYAPGLLHEFSGIEPKAYLSFLRDCGYTRFVAIPRDQGAIELGGDIGKLAEMPGRLGTTSVDFYAAGR